MHKQHEDQPSNELPNLSTWHRVPVGATIPKGTPYAYVNQNCVMLRLDGAYVGIEAPREGTYYTKRPVAPPLPTEPGTQILASIRRDRTPCVLMERTASDRGWYCSEYGYYYGDDEIVAWAPVTIGEVVVRP